MTDEIIEDETPEPEMAPTYAPSFWQIILGNLGLMSKNARRKQLVYRLQTLDDAIEIAPDVLSNYVLRGEVYLQLQQYEAAYRDFEYVRRSAIKEIAKSDWGIVAQAVQDRAERGLQKAQKHLS